MPEALTPSPSYAAIVRGLLRMHRLAEAGRFESEEADAVRDAMDEPWYGLSASERVRVEGLSADLNALTDLPSERAAEPMNPQAEGKLIEALEARQRGEWDRALGLLRRWDTHVSGASAAYLRGTIWLGAGDPAVAAVFFDRAARLDPANGNYQAALLRALKAADPREASRRAEQVLADSERRSPAAVAVALEVVLPTTSHLQEPEAAATCRRLAPLLERTLARLQEAEDTSPALVGMVVNLLALCHEQLGDSRRAYDCYSRAIQLDPRNDALLTARGGLMYGRSPQAQEDFEQAARLGSPLVWPYYFLAHSYLAAGRFEDARIACEQGLLKKASDRVRSELQEFLAISHAGLGYPEDVVRRGFEGAIRTDPSNDRARRNLERLESALAAREPRPRDWERPSESSLRTRRAGEQWAEVSPSASLLLV